MFHCNITSIPSLQNFVTKHSSESLRAVALEVAWEDSYVKLEYFILHDITLKTWVQKELS